jgi:heme/copper-type cytochrome/quinol oxidase subunit 2
MTTLVAAVAALGLAPVASATSWWLPPNYSKHGGAIDSLFNFIFWLTVIVNIAVFAVMAYFLIKYRYNPNRKKAHFTHGNPRLEMIWTILPAIVLMFISLFTKGVWDTYRFGNQHETQTPARLLVIGQQFKWNVVYAGPDNKLGKYLVFPKPSDKLWPKGPDGKPFTFSFGKYQDTAGPADMPYEDAVSAINAYIDQENPLGKDFSDPDGKDDNWEKQPGRPITLPVNRPIEVQLSSKDVIHDFFLPNFRVKLDAVPGLRGLIHFTPTITSKEIEDQNRKIAETPRTIDDVEGEFRLPRNRYLELLLAVDDKSEPKAKDDKSPGARFDTRARQWKYNGEGGKTLVRDGQPLSIERLEQLRQIGVKQVRAYRPGYFELVCEELCGGGHYTMRGVVEIVAQDEFKEKFETKQEEASSGNADSLASGK